MPLTVMSISSVTPRGGAPGTAIVVLGAGFGVVAGQIIFDPLGAAVVAPPTMWVNNRVECLVPAGVPRNRTVTLQIVKAGATDFTKQHFWIPAIDPINNGIDFQYPDFEAGTPTQDVDDPNKFQAADYNRLVDYARAVDALIPGGGGGGFTAKLEAFSPTLMQQIFTLAQSPAQIDNIVFFVNGVGYFTPGYFLVGGAGNKTITWGNLFTLDVNDDVRIMYYV